MHIKQSVFKLPQALRKPISTVISKTEILIWKLNRQPIPMPHEEKMKILLKYIQKFKLDIFIETGTYLGQTVDRLENNFDEVYSIELDKKLFKNAKKLFSDNKRINILQGDSAVVINKIVKKVKSPTLFWLDAHYSGGITAKGKKNTPVLKELTVIAKNMPKGSVVLIDDAREFTGNSGYPKLEVIKKFVEKKMPKYKMYTDKDIIQIYPSKTPNEK